MLKELKKLRTQTQVELFNDEPVMDESDIAYDKGYIAGITYVIEILEGTKTLPGNPQFEIKENN